MVVIFEKFVFCCLGDNWFDCFIFEGFEKVSLLFL